MRHFFVAVLLVSLCSVSVSVVADEPLRSKPFVLAETVSGALKDKVNLARSTLESAGFTVAGEYAPYSSAHIFLITNEQLKKQAAASDFGGYGVALRVAITEVAGVLQVSYTNPIWMGNVYRMEGDFNSAATKLKAALGWAKEFGSGGGRTFDNLREYHYMMFMPYFDDQVLLAEHASHQAALNAVESGLADSQASVGKVSRIDVTGSEQVLFGVAIKEGSGADEPIMNVVDQAGMRHTAHLPYELLVVGNRVYMLHGKFRIAQSFPDLTMSTFMQISDAPDAIETVLKAVASGK